MTTSVRVVKKTQNQIGLFAKLRKLRIAICESRENCEYLFEKSNQKKSPFFGKIFRNSQFRNNRNFRNPFYNSDLRALYVALVWLVIDFFRDQV